jgi:hypothetical protein
MIDQESDVADIDNKVEFDEDDMDDKVDGKKKKRLK